MLEKEELARQRVLDTPTHSPAYLRYVAQLNERTALKHEIANAPTVEAVPKSYAEQIRWERDVAVGQLNEIGCQFGQKMDEVKKLEAVPVVHCKECKNWHKDIGWCDKHSHFIDSDGSFCHPWESSNWKMFDENDFCSDGERRENETD